MRFVSAVNGGRSTGREQENDGTKKENESGEGHQQLAAAKKKYIFLDAIQSDKERKKQLKATKSQIERERERTQLQSPVIRIHNYRDSSLTHAPIRSHQVQRPLNRWTVDNFIHLFSFPIFKITIIKFFIFHDVL